MASFYGSDYYYEDGEWKADIREVHKMAKTKPLYQRMAINIATAQWCKEAPNDKWNMWAAKAVDNIAELPTELEDNIESGGKFSGVAIDWDESSGDKIILNAVLQDIEDINFNVVVTPSLMHGANVVVLFPGIMDGFRSRYDVLQKDLEAVFTEAFMEQS